MAKTVAQEIGGTRGVNGADKVDAPFAKKDDGLLPLPYFRPMRQRDI
jgi:hypothetical protein